jgi:Dolichyl-phosphate-mannose-protein mannosyltransferase
MKHMAFLTNRPFAKPLLAICVLSAAVRLAYLPFATLTSFDRTMRTWIAWRWLDDPELITNGVWGPLHTYLIALALAIYNNPVWSPVVMQIAFESAMPVLIFLFVRNEFRSSRAAILVALCYALYPLSILNTLALMTQPLFVFFVILGMLFISIARQENGSWKHAAFAGIAMTFAGMIRYEGWMLIPFLALILWRKPAQCAAFCACAMLHPTFWMVGNTLAHGDPLYSMNWASHWEMERMGRAKLSLSDKLSLVPRFLWNMLVWMTPPVAAAAGIGAILALVKRRAVAIWLVPLVGLLCLYGLGIVRGSLVPKYEYTQSVAFLLMPFAAVAFQSMGIDRFCVKKTVVAMTAFGVSIFAFSYPTIAVPHILKLSVDPIPAFRGQDELNKIVIPALKKHLRVPGDGFISDFYGWQATAYTPLVLKIHPDRALIADGAPFPNAESEFHQRASFFRNNPNGLLLLHSGSRFAEQLGYPAEDQFTVLDNKLMVQRLGAWPWEGFSRPELRASYGDEGSQLLLYRYALLPQQDTTENRK